MGVAESATLHHTCFVVHDVDKTSAELSGSLGLGPWEVFDVEPHGCTVRGRDVPFTFRVAITAVGGSHFELVAPLTGESLYVEHLATHGEGFHHTCIAYETAAAMQSAKAELLAAGRDLVQGGLVGENGEFCYFEIAEIGSILELLYLDPPSAD
jgi:catechol 2,3-dioxygenase-like lactoylglutathione lyase family enzyme